MKLETSKNKKLDVQYAEGPTRITGNLVIIANDLRPFSEVCADYENLKWIKAEDGREWNGFTELVMAARMADGTVRISLARGVV